MQIALFIACFNDALFPQTGRAIVKLLRRLGHDVHFPDRQTCCGQMHFNTGYQDDCIPMAERFADLFERYDAVLNASGSCTAMVRDYYSVLADRAGSPQLARRTAAVASKTYELSELLIDVLGVTDTGSYFPHRVTYHPTCHTLRMLGVGDRPTQLLRAVAGLELLDLPDATDCCGFGGTFAMKNADTSVAMGTDKVSHVMSTGAEVLTAADNSCLMHIGGLLSRGRSPIAAVHYAEILASTEQEPLQTGEVVPDVWPPVQARQRQGSGS